MEQNKEKDIICRVLKGDRDAYALLIEEYKGPIFNLAYRMTCEYQDAEDLAQEAFVRAYNTLKRFDTDKRFFPWLYTIALNLIRNHLKKKKPSLADEASANKWLDNGDSPEQAVVKRQQAEQLNSCLQKLPVDLREAIILRFYQDLLFEDLSEILDISLSAAKMRVYRGLEKLRSFMEESS